MLPILLVKWGVTKEWINEHFTYQWLVDLLKDFYYWIVQTLVDMATWTLVQAGEFMPSFAIATDGVSSLQVNVNTVLSMIAWIFPFDALLFSLALITANHLAFFTAGPLLRWIKVIQ